MMERDLQDLIDTTGLIFWGVLLYVVLLLFFGIGCAPISYSTSRAMLAATSCPEQQAFLISVRVEFMTGMVNCEGIRAWGCFKWQENKVEVALIDWDKPVDAVHGSYMPPWRYESAVEETLRHEYVHALQYHLTGRWWHPADGEGLPECVSEGLPEQPSVSP